jgi:hypothetical protein
MVLTKKLKNLDDNHFNFEKEVPKKTLVKTFNHHFIFLTKITIGKLAIFMKHIFLFSLNQ